MRKCIKQFTLIFAVTLLAIGLAASVFADSITLTDQTFDSGVGFGAVTNLLSLQESSGANEDGVETGSVAPPGDTLTDNAKNTSHTYTSAELAALGLDETNLGLVFNISEEGNNGTVILEDFGLDIYEADGTLVGTVDSLTCTDTGILSDPCGRIEFGGTGTAGYIMTTTSLAGGLLEQFFNNPDWIMGAHGTISSVDDGQENFYFVKIEGTNPPTVVPEPSSMLLLGTGLLAAGAMVTRRKKS